MTRATAALLALAATLPAWLSASEQAARAGATPVDRIVVRFTSPETGDVAHPSFVEQRTLAFEARIAVMAERADGLGMPYEERHVREALDHEVAATMLSGLARRLIGGSTREKQPSPADIERSEQDVMTALLERVGGRERLDAAAAAEQLDSTEVNALLRRDALAAWYIDHAITPVLGADEEQLREAFRTGVHPFQGRSFDDVREPLRRWLALERLRSAESAFLRASRSHLTLVVTR